MLIQSGIDFNIRFVVLDPDPHAPCSSLAEFYQGKLTDFDTVLKFGSACDVITIEIENVNTAALKELVKLGKKVYPQDQNSYSHSSQPVPKLQKFSGRVPGSSAIVLSRTHTT